MRVRGRDYRSGNLVDVAVRGGRIDTIQSVSLDQASHEPADIESGWIAPALFDLQINGCDGHSFNSAELTIDKIRHVVEVCQRHGVAALCPTLVTASFDAIAHGMSTLRQACEADPDLARAIPAIHLEGPYISPEDGPRGAHPKKHVRHPDWDQFCRWQDASGGRIRLVTLAPELDGAIPFIEKLVASGVTVALGHTNASGDAIRAAQKAGARLSTHLGNGSHAVLPRHENYLWHQLANDELWASIIADGHHLPPQLVKCFLRIKSPARTILTCDAGSLAGLPPGRYREWDQEFDVVPEGKIVLAGTSYLAGSWAFTDLCVGNVLRFAEVTLQQAIDMASSQPRQLLNLPPRPLEAGAAADLILFDHNPGSEQEAFTLRGTIVAGKHLSPTTPANSV